MKEQKHNFSRYHSQLILPQIGSEGQRKLKKSKVLIVGAGGLGSVVALYLTASGVGYIGIVDHDIVELNNLQRQIVHNEDSIGMPKAVSAMINLKRLNSEVNILPYPEEINEKNAWQIIKPYEVVIACPDNFRTRFILNDVCFKLEKPLIMGAVSEFEGHVFDILPPQGPCYECLFSEARDEDALQRILSPVAGVIGALQAVETIKILLRIGKPLHGRMFIYNALNGFREFKFLKDPFCKICSDVKN